MATRTVRLDDESEAALLEIQGATGMNMSQALKRGLLLLRDSVRARSATSAWEVYERLDLGPGGYAAAPARDVKKVVRESVRRKLRR